MRSVKMSMRLRREPSRRSKNSTGTAMMTILCGCLVLYLADKAEKLAEQLGGSIDNSFGKQLQSDAQTLWKNTKSVAGKIYKDWKDKK